MCYYDQTGKTAGEEVSSTYEGRHLTIVESELRHPYHSDGFVDKGEPVVHTTATGHIVGVAFTSAAAATDLIAIDTEGIWYLTVRGYKDGAPAGVGTAATINPGDQIFINFTTDQTYAGTLSGISDFETQLPFGYALDGVVSGTSEIIAVKVHANFYGWDLYHSNASAAADDGVSLTVNDTGNYAGMGRGLNVDYIQNGANAGKEVDGINIGMLVQKATQYAYGIAIYTSQSGNPATGLYAGLSIYMDDPGTGMAVGAYRALDIGIDLAGRTVGYTSFMRLRSHNATLPTSVMQLDGTGTATFLIDETQLGAGPAVNAAAGGGLANMKFAVRVAGTTYYIPTYVS